MTSFSTGPYAFPDVPTLASNLRDTLAHADAAAWETGRTWYGTARAWAEREAADHGRDADTVAAVVAALSPRTPWSVNLRWAHDVISRRDADACPGVSTGRNRALACGLDDGTLTLDALTGPKRRAFFHNISGRDADAVTVDVWAARACGIIPGARGVKLTAAQYECVADAYRLVAAEYGMPASELQAVAWTTIRQSTKWRLRGKAE